MMDYLTTFLAVFFLDLVYTHYLRSVQNNKPLTASFWSMFCYLGASVAIINFTENHLLLIPALVGAFFGTYVGMKIKK
jgi:hypothetical protein